LQASGPEFDPPYLHQFSGEAIRIAPGLANRAERERYPSSPPWISGVAGVRARLKSERSGFDSSGIHQFNACVAQWQRQCA
jgi:hypothetical protein